MYDFMTKLFQIALPRVRDFQGVSLKAFDKAGNYTLGLSEQIVFPEIDYSKIDKTRGLEITFVSTAGDAKIAKRLLELLGMPFKK
jgi:large subunit ribosomal protein L5